ncbi:hypothetical protein [Salinibacillus xinjiangensis]|uniref:Ferritin-like domain-containing protein n=1 Tax=Salinibacillus xinjiangensis TaxID=1229268 RepID=A0A6G1X2M8_9BACI|nr:hypothetical protein [Salinibacillus xinjiangensis]MRG85146.1 hypothetical protein [Salinibacillus xinjiangensis]
MAQQQQNNQFQQSNPMPAPPNMISTKDHLYLTDMLSWNLNASKKAYFFAQQCSDQEVKAALEGAGQMHQNHYQKILQHLNKNPSPQVSN